MSKLVLKSQKGFTLIELLIYIGIFSIVSGLMTGILTTTLKINQRESSAGEVSSQINFVIQTIQRLTRESSAIIANSTSTDYDNDGTLGAPQSRLVLRMKDSGASPTTDRDPIVIYSEGNKIKMSEGSGANQRISDLTSDRVAADQLQFIKYVQYPGHDTVSIDLQLSYNTQNPQAKATRNLRTAISRVSAAVFDSNLLPGNDNQYEMGYANQRWKNISISNLLNLGQISTDPAGAQNGAIYYNTSNSVFRGYANGAWNNLGGGYWSASSTSIYYNSGNVGIGTSTPTAGKLVVNGTIDVSNNKITSLSTPTASSDAATKGYVDAAAPSFAGALVYHNTNQSLPGATMTTIAWNSEDYDTTSIHDTVTNNSRLVVPAGVTKVKLSANLFYNTNVGSIESQIVKNGVAVVGSPSELYQTSNSTYKVINITSPVLNVIGGDYFEVKMYNAGGNASLYNSALVVGLTHKSWFAMEIVE